METRIRDWLLKYLSGEISLKEFRIWFAPVSMDNTGYPLIMSLIGDLSDLDEGFMKEIELLQKISLALLPCFPVTSTASQIVYYAVTPASDLTQQ